MKNILVIALGFSLFISHTTSAQAPQNPINILRYNDNFQALKSDSTKTGLQKLKYMSLGKNTFLSLGGELREVYQYFGNQNFGDVPPTFEKVSTGQVWHRIMAHANLEIGTKARVFFQLNNTLRLFNPNPLTPEIDENALSIHQAFVDWNINKNWQLRLGRQEMGYGNNRILTFREGPNTRLTFDAAILKYKNSKRRLDFLAVSPVISKPEAFDDQSLKDFVIGVYANEILVPKKILLDYYFLNFTSSQRKYNYLGGEENRQSYGFRVFSQSPKFNYELEGTYQTGTFDQQKIQAYGVSADVNYRLSDKNSVILGLAANYISGDKDRTDQELNTYNLIFSKPSYGLAAPIGSSNIENINPYLKLNPLKKVFLQAGMYFMQRNSNQDGTYSPGMAQLRPNRDKLYASTNRAIGTQYSFEANYNPTHKLSFATEMAFFEAGQYVKETGKGQNITYFSIKSSFKF
ncbi:MAG: alginate export family protein [Leadbetterella sp.]